MDITVSDNERATIASNFLLQAPPGEFNDVFNDVRSLLGNDELLKNGCGAAIAKHYKDNFAPVQIEGAEELTLITPFNELPDGRFIDPKSAKIFKYDYLKKEVSNVQNANPGDIDQNLEAWRKILQAEADNYSEQHFLKSGVATVFTSNGVATLCIESHQFQPKNFWNGLWRSQWTLPAIDGKSGTQEFHGIVKTQVHYYEEGNVQLISNKEMTIKVNVSSDVEKTAKDIFAAITEQESIYQTAVQENYVNLSDQTFKSLRRQLPVTRTKLDWLKIHSYRVAQDLRPPQ